MEYGFWDPKRYKTLGDEARATGQWTVLASIAWTCIIGKKYRTVVAMIGREASDHISVVRGQEEFVLSFAVKLYTECKTKARLAIQCFCLCAQHLGLDGDVTYMIAQVVWKDVIEFAN